MSIADSELTNLADQLYEAAEDDDVKLAELMRNLPEQTAHALCTSNLTNAAQAYIYAFGDVPDVELYDVLLLKSSYYLRKGILLETVEMGDIIFKYDKNSAKFVISASNGDISKSFDGFNALKNAREWAREYCAE